MKERYNILFAVFSIVFIITSIFSVYADSSNSSNATNITNTTNVTKNVTKSAVVKPMSIGDVSIVVTPQNIDLGPLAADGSEHAYSGATNVTVNTSLIVSGTFSVRATGNFISGSNTIPLNNFKYTCPGDINVETPFTTSNQLIDDYSWNWEWNHKYIMNYYLTIPINTNPGTYSTTIIYTAT